MADHHERHAAAWARLVADARAFTECHSAPEGVAHLVWEAAVLGFVNGTQHAVGRTYEEMRADFLKDYAIVTGVLDVAEADCERWFALRELRTHAGALEESDDA